MPETASTRRPRLSIRQVTEHYGRSPRYVSEMLIRQGRRAARTKIPPSDTVRRQLKWIAAKRAWKLRCATAQSRRQLDHDDPARSVSSISTIRSLAPSPSGPTRPVIAGEIVQRGASRSTAPRCMHTFPHRITHNPLDGINDLCYI